LIHVIILFFIIYLFIYLFVYLFYFVCFFIISLLYRFLFFNLFKILIFINPKRFYSFSIFEQKGMENQISSKGNFKKYNKI